MARTVFVGDVHGCVEELDALLEHVGLSPSDRLVMVGDLVVRGPAPRGVLDRLIDLGARSVRGNHEDRLLRMRAGDVPVGAQQRPTFEALKKRHWEWLAGLPYWIDLPEHDVRVVHAGVLPGVAIEAQAPRTLMNIRCLSAAGEPVEKRGPDLWGLTYAGPPHVVFGHSAASEPQLHAWATGLDTGCVYGGRLTAMVLRAGERPPPQSERTSVLVSIPARRRYAST